MEQKIKCLKTKKNFFSLECLISRSQTSFNVNFVPLRPLPNFFGQVMFFCKYVWVDSINTYFKFLQTLSLVVAYWHTLEKT
jgi:hypothetical protein